MFCILTVAGIWVIIWRLYVESIQSSNTEWRGVSNIGDKKHRRKR